ncbi:C40 family peptidase [Cohnella caldifontis]|uniref:C40 family peptidase n=1 Tax=Cohnella caldifontis TaxID=3027471 RepID=UPI0023EC9EEF|nr:C40 family peptidase [Cohnella sp. YIM B05605]
MNIAKLTKKAIVASVLGLSLIAAQLLGAGAHTANAATSASVSASSAKATKIVNYALSLRGKVKYKFGVNNPSKLIFDCSSFTKYVFGKYGVPLKWGTKYQAKQGRYVSKSNLKPGDLIFLSVSTPGKINHVGIYIGNGKFIHDTIGAHWNGLLVSKLSDYSKRYITARRVL